MDKYKVGDEIQLRVMERGRDDFKMWFTVIDISGGFPVVKLNDRDHVVNPDDVISFKPRHNT